MATQAGLHVSRDDGGEKEWIDLKAKNVFNSAEGYDDDFELAFQLPLETEFVLFVNDNTTEHVCKCTESPSAPNVYYIDVVNAIRVPVVVDTSVRVRLVARWTDRKRVKHEQTVLDGELLVSSDIQTMGAPGFQFYVPHLKTLAYLSVGNVIQGDGTVRMEFIMFHLTVLV